MVIVLNETWKKFQERCKLWMYKHEEQIGAHRYCSYDMTKVIRCNKAKNCPRIIKGKSN